MISCSILTTSKEESIDSVIADLKLFFTIFSLENERSSEHVVTGSVKHILYSAVTLRYAMCKLCWYNSCSISLIDSQFLISWWCQNTSNSETENHIHWCGCRVWRRREKSKQWSLHCCTMWLSNVRCNSIMTTVFKQNALIYIYIYTHQDHEYYNSSTKSKVQGILHLPPVLVDTVQPDSISVRWFWLSRTS